MLTEIKFYSSRVFFGKMTHIGPVRNQKAIIRRNGNAGRFKGLQFLSVGISRDN